MIAAAVQKMSGRINPVDHLGLAAKFVLRYLHAEYRRLGLVFRQPVEDTEEFSFACVVLLKAADTYKPEHGATFSTYAYFCLNKAFRYRFRTKRRNPEPKYVDPTRMERFASENCTDASCDGGLLAVFLADRPDLSESEKIDLEMLKQRYLHEKKLGQIAKLYGVTPGRVKQRIDRAISNIRKKYNAYIG